MLLRQRNDDVSKRGLGQWLQEGPGRARPVLARPNPGQTRPASAALPGVLSRSGKLVTQPRRRALAALPARPVTTAVCLGLGVAIAAPLVVLVVESFQKPTGLVTSVFSLDTYRQVFTGAVMHDLVASLEIGVGGAVFATVIGTTLAWLVTRTDMPWRRFFEVANFVPFFLTPLILAIAWTYLCSPQIGLLNHLAVASGATGAAPIDIYSLGGIIFVETMANAPLAFLLVAASMRQMDPALEQAARSCGSNPIRATLRVTLPLATPAVISAAVLTFMLSFEDLGAPLVLGQPAGIEPLPIRIYDTLQQAFPPNYNFAAGLGCLMITIPAIGFWLQRRVTGRRSYATVTGKATQPARLTLGRGKWPAFALTLIYVSTAVFLPLGALLIAAFSRHWSGTIDPALFTLSNFAQLFASSTAILPALQNSLTLAVSMATAVVVAAVVASYGVTRLRVWGGRIIDIVLSAPLAVPGTALAVGVLALLLRTPLFGTIWIIGLGYAIRYFPYGQRNVGASLAAVHPELEDASRVAGSGMARTVARIVVPLLRAGLVSGWLLLFVMFMREVTMSNLLYTGGNETLSAALLIMMNNQSPGVVAAFTIVQVGLLLIPATLVILLGGRSAVGAHGVSGTPNVVPIRAVGG